MPFRRITLDELPRPLVGCHAVAAGDLLFVGGLLPSDYRTGIASEAQPKSSIASIEDAAAPQSAYILRTAERTLAACGTSLSNVVRIDQFITSRNVAAPYLRERRKAFDIPRRPASTLLAVPGLPVPAARVSADIIAAAAKVQKKGIFSEKVAVNFPGAPHGAQAGQFVFVQGQIATDFVGTLAPEAAASPFWYETPVERQTDFILKNLAAILEAADSSLSDVVKAHIYLTNLSEFSEFERVWARYFSSSTPARTVVPVVSLGSPECQVEINVIALRRGSPRKYVNCAPTKCRAPLHESDAVHTGEFLFLSGLLPGDFIHGLAPEAMVPLHAPYFGSEIDRQVRWALEKAANVCAAAGGSLEDLCSAQVFLSDMSDYFGFTKAWNEVLGHKQPTVTTVQVPALTMCPHARVLLDLTAYFPEKGAG
jgi:enamine deaminase RidA (YjgF/YER057c/UK114 family)